MDPEPVKAAPEQFRQIGQEVSEQMDYEPARYFRRRVVRRTYVSKVVPDTAPVSAPCKNAASPPRGCWQNARNFKLAPNERRQAAALEEVSSRATSNVASNLVWRA